MTGDDRVSVHDLFQRFVRLTEACPVRPPDFDESKPFSEHGSVKARLDTCAVRVSDLEVEWKLLAQEHTPTHRNGIAYLIELKKTISELESSNDFTSENSN